MKQKNSNWLFKVGCVIFSFPNFLLLITHIWQHWLPKSTILTATRAEEPSTTLSHIYQFKITLTLTFKNGQILP